MTLQEYLISKQIISEGTLEHATNFSNSSVQAINKKYRTIENSLLLIQSLREESLVSATNAFNRNNAYACVSSFTPTDNCFKVLTPDQQLELETAILRVDVKQKIIVVGFATKNENVRMRVRSIIARSLQNYALDEKEIYEIPHLQWVRSGYERLNRTLPRSQHREFKPIELDVSIGERLITTFRLAIEFGATDVSFETNADGMSVYLIVDKVRRLFKNVKFTIPESESVVTWIVTKSGIAQNLSNQKIIDCALPELGTGASHRGRVNKLDSYYGATINVRLLPNKSEFIEMSKLNYTPFIQSYMDYIAKPRKGLILFLGETNSGKNTSVLALISEQKDRYERKIVSLEQPVEYLVPGLQQIPADTDEEYEEISRALVRQSTDTIYLSEIRDRPTIETAISTSRTGKMVISTMHVSHAFDIFNRAEDLHGSDVSTKLTSELIGVINQVLLPKACPECLVEIPRRNLKDEYRAILDNARYNGSIYDNTGKTADGKVCPYCDGYGSKKIVPAAEYIHFDEGLKRELRKLPNSSNKEELLIEVMKSKQNSLLQDGLRQMGMKNVSISVLIERDILSESYSGGELK